jgi:hypothetical protein
VTRWYNDNTARTGTACELAAGRPAGSLHASDARRREGGPGGGRVGARCWQQTWQAYQRFCGACQRSNRCLMFQLSWQGTVCD